MKPSFAYFICFSPRGFATISLDQVAMPRPPRDAQLPNPRRGQFSPVVSRGNAFRALRYEFIPFGLGTFMPAQTKPGGYTFEPF